MSSLHDLTAVDQAAAIRARELSPVELTDWYLDRIAKIDGELGAYLTVTAGPARDQALRAEAAVRSGEALPALHGVPIAIKDMARVAGVRTTRGSAVGGEVADSDDHVVTRLRRAGTVLLGKTNTSEFAMTCYTENRIAPPTRNPWKLDHSPGGSSGGAAAAVAAGLAPLAHGTDHGGSVRIPASACGLVGLKPSRGRVSNGPGGDFSGLSTHGPIARTVADAAALLDAMTGPMPGESRVAPGLPEGETFLDHARRAPGRLRIAAVTTPLLPGVPLHPDCRAAFLATAELLGSLGHEVVEVELPELPGLADAFISVMASLATVPEVPDEQALMPFTRTLRELAGGVSGQRLARSLSTFESAAAQLAAGLFGDHDVVLSPTLAQPPGLIGGLRDDADQDAEFAAQAAFMPFTPLYNPTGLPSVSLPAQWNAEGLPIGIMLGGRYGAEALLLSLSAQLEAARPWSDRRPDLW